MFAISASLVLHIGGAALIFPRSSNLSEVSVEYRPDTKAGPHRSHKSSKLAPRVARLLDREEAVGEEPSAESTATSTSPLPGAESESVAGTELGIDALYPRMSRVLKETGTVLVSVDADGIATVKRSSGFARLDDSATTAVSDAYEAGKLRALLTSRPRVEIILVFRLTGLAD